MKVKRNSLALKLKIRLLFCNDNYNKGKQKIETSETKS